MEMLIDLWLPILLSAAAVFIVSSFLHMVIPIHKNDYATLPGEANVLEAMRAQGVKPGQYAFPRPSSMKEMGSPEMIAKYNEGPVGFMHVMPSSPPAMGKLLTQWFLFSILISIFAAYIAGLTLSRGSDYMVVFRITSTVAALGYGFAQISESIWKGQKMSTTLKFIFDGIIYGLVTGGVFGWMWPGV